MALAHISHTSLHIIFEWTLDEIHYWLVEALKLHNKLNSTETAN